MSNELWGPIDIRAWRAVPHIVGRVATEADVRAGSAAFFTPVGPQDISNTPHHMSLPALALLRTDDGPRSIPVIIIQAEEGPRGVIVGYRSLEGGNGVCLLSELDLLAENDPRLLAAS